LKWEMRGASLGEGHRMRMWHGGSRQRLIALCALKAGVECGVYIDAKGSRKKIIAEVGDEGVRSG
jgi:hypothetical protein